MSVPLGFRRSTRKKLRWCEHTKVLSTRHIETTARVVQCAQCGAGALCDLPPVLLDRNRSSLPERIATERLRFGPPKANEP
jgi:hypothetical protein